MTIKKFDRVEFENGQTLCRGTVIAPYTDSQRPDMEETWIVNPDQVMLPVFEIQDSKDHQDKPIKKKVLVRHDVLQIVNDDGVQTKTFLVGGEPLLFVKDGSPNPFRVRARRMKVVGE